MRKNLLKKFISGLFFAGVICMLLTSVLTSCSKSPEEKAKELSESKIKESLIIPDSYDLASIELDSAFSPYDTPEFYDLTVELAKDGVAINEVRNDKQHAKSSIALWSGPYQTSYDRTEQNSAREKYRQAKNSEANIIRHAKGVAEKMRIMLSKEPEFIGMKAKVKYRAKNNDGEILMSTAKVVFDKDMTKVNDIYDMDGDEYQAFITICHEIQDNDNNND